jgi:aerobic carbon-monoxide dehydrogenase medium subunit
MIPAKFDYTRPSSLGEAVSALSSGGEDAKVIAGGQSLLPLLRLRFSYPSLLVDVGGLDELHGVRDLGDSLEIGALTTHYELTRDPLIAAHCGLLAEAAGMIADPAVRHRGTIGGGLAHADPAGDLPAVITALDATLVAAGPGGTRTISPADFFVDYLTTSLAPDEILTAIRVPKLDGWGYRYEKFNVTAQAWAIVGVAAVAQRSNGQVTAARVGLTNMGSVPVRAHAVEGAAAGSDASAAALAAAAARADEGTNPPDDLRAASDYRRHLARVLTGRALAAAAGVS